VGGQSTAKNRKNNEKRRFLANSAKRGIIRSCCVRCAKSVTYRPRRTLHDPKSGIPAGHGPKVTTRCASAGRKLGVSLAYQLAVQKYSKWHVARTNTKGKKKRKKRDKANKEKVSKKRGHEMIRRVSGRRRKAREPHKHGSHMSVWKPTLTPTVAFHHGNAMGPCG